MATAIAQATAQAVDYAALSAALSIIPTLPRPILSRLVARAIEQLDQLDGDIDMEPEEDVGEVEDWRPDGVTLPRPLYGSDQSTGPINERQVERFYRLETMKGPAA